MGNQVLGVCLVEAVRGRVWDSGAGAYWQNVVDKCRFFATTCEICWRWAH